MVLIGFEYINIYTMAKKSGKDVSKAEKAEKALKKGMCVRVYLPI